MVNGSTGYLAPLGMEKALEAELRGISLRHGRLFIADGPPQKAHWVQNFWYEPQVIPFQSINEAVNILRSQQSLWAYYPFISVRRGELIRAKLPYFAPKPTVFQAALPTVPLGSWTLLDDHTLLCSPSCSSLFPHGELHFHETKEPPSRAYLKLWEFFTLQRCWPKPGDHCLEIGASPGGWSWVLLSLDARVTAVDKAPLATTLAQKATFVQKDAFSLTPSTCPDIQWLFSDLICYPAKLLAWLRPWLDKEIQIVCTLKFQGREDYAILKEFERIKESGLIHLFHNKHELTWYRLKR